MSLTLKPLMARAAENIGFPFVNRVASLHLGTRRPTGPEAPEGPLRRRPRRAAVLPWEKAPGSGGPEACDECVSPKNGPGTGPCRLAPGSAAPGLARASDGRQRRGGGAGRIGHAP